MISHYKFTLPNHPLESHPEPTSAIVFGQDKNIDFSRIFENWAFELTKPFEKPKFRLVKKVVG